MARNERTRALREVDERLPIGLPNLGHSCLATALFELLLCDSDFVADIRAYEELIAEVGAAPENARVTAAVHGLRAAMEDHVQGFALFHQFLLNSPHLHADALDVLRKGLGQVRVPSVTQHVGLEEVQACVPCIAARFPHVAGRIRRRHGFAPGELHTIPRYFHPLVAEHPRVIIDAPPCVDSR
ncbi:BZ3500_MvSof-1268-A1-R1_Chr1-1g01237 [Microbotryum saponariae]|uniref:BZ3500_MvSof-1268-A1-R1_Chr1-1g01237 protein n=1 Tax=Microbotryum saponariae TaxID=289078 RepID=A0A2X0K9W2_9BASI|nr:BZ3500_MvSof-1268-A1-R1_Chr1-1g01237 [Microbotryum saponariae]SCZ93752.1 BZ3501_MvSof-1269-A2-R1_Chr1-1g00833 [Microbotryum saponariae]